MCLSINVLFMQAYFNICIHFQLPYLKPGDHVFSRKSNDRPEDLCGAPSWS